MKLSTKLLLAVLTLQVLLGCKETADVSGFTAPSASGTPAAPTGFSTSGVSSTGLTVNWTDNADNEVIYEIQQCTGSGCTSFSAVTLSPRPADATSVAITGLSAGTTYVFRVRATNSSGSSDWLTSGDVSTSAVTVGDPTGFTVSAQETTSISFSWTDNATTETGYEVESCTGAACSTFAAVAGSPLAADSTSTSVTGLTASTTYRFRVRAVNGGSSSSWLTSSDVKTAPAAPTGITTGTVTGSSIQISWTDNASDETAYAVESCTGTGCTSYAAVASSPLGADSVTHTETGLSESTTYRFRVKATNSNGSSSYLTSGDITTPITAPSGLNVTALGDTSLTLNWTDNSTTEFIYEIQQCTGSGCTPSTSVSLSPRPAGSTSVAVSGLTEATVYVFRVRASNSNGSSSWVTTGDITTDPTPVTAPSLLVISDRTQTSVSIGWADNSSNETGFEVEYCSGAGCTIFVPVAGSPYAANAVAATVSGLSASTTYRFRVRSVTASTQSAWLTSNDVTTSPAAPTVLTTGTVSTTSIQVGWTDNASDELIYEIEKCAGASCSSFAAASNSPKAANSVSYTETGLTENTTYRLRVRAVSSNGNSTYLTSGDITTLMEPPTSLTVGAVTDTTVPLTWADNSASETGYEVEQCAGSGCSGFAAVAGSPFAAGSTGTTISGLTASTIYRFRVRAAGATPSTYATSTDVTTAPAAPTVFVDGTIAYNSVDFTWTDNASDEVNYQVERCTGASCSGFAALTTALAPNTAAYTDTTVSGGATYKYRVRAVNSNGNSAYLTSGDIAVPVAPTTPLACTSPNTVVVDYGQKGVTAGTTRGLYADVKYIPSGTAVGTGAAAGNTIVTYSTNVGVAYYDTGALAIKYAYWNGSTFTVETVMGDTAANVYGVKLAYLSNSPNTGIPIIFWASGNGGGNAGQITMAVRSTASLTTAGTWTVSAIDSTGGATNKALSVAVSPIDQVLIAYQASTLPAVNVARAIICPSSCNSAANYLTMGSSQIATATANQIRLGAAWCNMGSGVYNPAVSYGEAAAVKYNACKPGTNTFTTCQLAGGWSAVNILGTGALVISDIYIDPNITNDVPKAIVKDATNVKGYKGNAGCQTTASFTYTAGTILGSNVANTANSFYKLMKVPDYATPANERYIVMANDAATDVKWSNSQGSDPSNTTWNALTALQTVPLNAVGTPTGGADLNTTTGQMVAAYGSLTANTFNITLGVVDNYTLASNLATNVYFTMPVDTSGHMQLNAAQMNNIALAVTSTNRPGIAYVDFSGGTATTGKLKYAIRNSATYSGSSWVVQTIPGPTTTFSPQFPSIAFDSNNMPWIGYFEANTNRFYLTTNTAIDGSGTWVHYQFPNAGTHGAPAAGPAMNMTAVAMSYVGGVSKPVMIIMDTGTTDQVKSARFTPSTGTWSNLVQIGTLGATGANSLSADFSTTSDMVVIAFYDIAGTRMKYAYTADGGATWPSAFVNVSSSGTSMGVGARIRLNPVTGKPAIAYYDRPNARLFFATCANTPASCTSSGNWSGTSSSVLNGIGIGGVANTNEALLTTGLTFSAAGDAYINYVSGTLDVGGIRMIDNIGGTMPSGLATTVIPGINGTLSNAGAVNGGIPWSIQSERLANGVLGMAYLTPGNLLGYTSCGD